MVVRLIVKVVVDVVVRVDIEEIRFVARANIRAGYHTRPDFLTKSYATVPWLTLDFVVIVRSAVLRRRISTHLATDDR